MKIGNVSLRNNLVVAPMAGVTDRPFRQLCKAMGAGMAVSEMVASNSLLWGSEKTIRRGNHEGEVEPKVIQIAGSDPAMMAEAARYNVDKGAQIIDINMGCPAKKICNVAAGSALLKDEPLVARIAEESGIAAIALHGRTRACMYTGEAEYDTIKAVKASVAIPVMANGDIDSPEKAKFVLDYTGADAVMIGRAAQGRPWIFREIAHYLETGGKLAPPAVAEIREVLLAHLDDLYAFYGAERGSRVARKHIAWYTKGLKNSAVFRARMNQLQTSGEQLEAVRAFFDGLAERSERLEYDDEVALAA